MRELLQAQLAIKVVAATDEKVVCCNTYFCCAGGSKYKVQASTVSALPPPLHVPASLVIEQVMLPVG